LRMLLYFTTKQIHIKAFYCVGSTISFLYFGGMEIKNYTTEQVKYHFFYQFKSNGS